MLEWFMTSLSYDYEVIWFDSSYPICQMECSRLWEFVYIRGGVFPPFELDFIKHAETSTLYGNNFEIQQVEQCLYDPQATYQFE